MPFDAKMIELWTCPSRKRSGYELCVAGSLADPESGSLIMLCGATERTDIKSQITPAVERDACLCRHQKNLHRRRAKLREPNLRNAPLLSAQAFGGINGSSNLDAFIVDLFARSESQSHSAGALKNTHFHPNSGNLIEGPSSFQKSVPQSEPARPIQISSPQHVLELAS